VSGAGAAAEGFRCGLCAVVGRPNVGKSTLVNALLGRKLSIVARKAQTTRHRILGVRSGAGFQAILVDTPGLHGRRDRALNRYLNRTAESAAAEVDVIVMVVEAPRWHEGDDRVLGTCSRARAPCILAVNKIDRLAGREALLPYLGACDARAEFVALVPISAHRGDNVEALLAEVVRRLPPGPALFPVEQYTDRPERFLAAESIREKLTWHLGEEVPHRLTVDVERWQERADGLVEIGATVWVERPGQKAIAIGRGGRVLKRVGAQARGDLEALLGRRVFLELWVKVKEGWTDDERLLRELGYHD